MSKQRSPRFQLLLYQHVLGRLRSKVFYIGVLLLGLWLLGVAGFTSWPAPPLDRWLLMIGLLAMLFWLISGIATNLAYVQPRSNHLRLQTPLYRVKISYRRIESTRPVDLARMFPPKEVSGGTRNTLKPFYPQTALGVDLRAWPINPRLLKIFFHPTMIAPDRPGFILIVKDWMKLSNQIAAATEAQRKASQVSDPTARIGAADILGEDRW